ncbi:MAG: hypothetical protein ACPG52_02780 [Cognaticolwellia sp.]
MKIAVNNSCALAAEKVLGALPTPHTSLVADFFIDITNALIIQLYLTLPFVTG